MDMKPFKLDIDELIRDFAEGGSTTLADMKRVWLSRKFSFIFEASPSTNLACFMQSLYSHSIGYMASTASLSHRLGGFYCLYCLHETQPFKPPFKIYLSLGKIRTQLVELVKHSPRFPLSASSKIRRVQRGFPCPVHMDDMHKLRGELKRLKNLVIDAKKRDIKVVSALVKRMLERNIFLFGFVDINKASIRERVNELTEIQNTRVQVAHKKLFADSRIEHFIHMDLGMELDVDMLKKISTDYAVAKELAIKEAGEAVNVQNIKHIAEDKSLIGDVVEKTSEDWNAQKEMFYQQTGFRQRPAQEPQQQEKNGTLEQLKGNETSEEQEDDDEFGKELEEALQFEDDNE